MTTRRAAANSSTQLPTAEYRDGDPEGEMTVANEVLGVADLLPIRGYDIRDEAAMQPTLLIKTIAPMAFSAAHIAAVAATSWILMLNGIVGYQLLEDGTAISMELVFGSSLAFLIPAPLSQFSKALHYKVVIIHNPVASSYQVQKYRRHNVHHFKNSAVKDFFVEAVPKFDRTNGRTPDEALLVKKLEEIAFQAETTGMTPWTERLLKGQWFRQIDKASSTSSL
ncbi:hypothetical protein EJ08DRAFT_695303 [Tothia fuscella]|uniref:Uncharacterized protein n=1 Tax=Tothia fuscella TaxID=1048955 RepID=A0A9P4NVK9_9PEZI|nr:hypothetical protein EJ08DRAFT_695303 [Tothia fuscella]